MEKATHYGPSEDQMSFTSRGMGATDLLSIKKGENRLQALPSDEGFSQGMPEGTMHV